MLSAGRGNAQNVVADDVIGPGTFVVYGLGKHGVDLVATVGEYRHRLGQQLLVKPHMGQLIPVDHAENVGTARHQHARSQVIEKDEPVVEVQAFQQVVGQERNEVVFGGGAIDVLLVESGDELTALLQYPIVAPELVNGGAAIAGNHRFDDVLVRLVVHRLLGDLLRQAQGDFRCGGAVFDVGHITGLYRIQKGEVAENAVEGATLGSGEIGVVGDILGDVDFLGNPEVFSHLAIEADGPAVAHIVELHQVGGFPKPDSAIARGVIAIGEIYCFY